MTEHQPADETFFPRAISLDSRWVLVAYCFLVVFVLLPTFLVTPLVVTVTEGNYGKVVVWLLTGVACISFMVGVLSRRFTVVEAGVATFLFLVTLIFELDWGRTSVWGSHLPLSVRPLAELIMWAMWSIFLAIACAMVGRWVRLRLRRQAAMSAIRS